MKRKPKNPEAAARLAELYEAAKAVIAKHNPPTLGPCHFCEWPIARHAMTAPVAGGFDMVLACDLCEKRLDTIFTRYFEYEEPLSAI